MRSSLPFSPSLHVPLSATKDVYVSGISQIFQCYPTCKAACNTTQHCRRFSSIFYDKNKNDRRGEEENSSLSSLTHMYVTKTLYGAIALRHISIMLYIRSEHMRTFVRSTESLESKSYLYLHSNAQ